jgi:hypothetical protein
MATEPATDIAASSNEPKTHAWWGRAARGAAETPRASTGASPGRRRPAASSVPGSPPLRWGPRSRIAPGTAASSPTASPAGWRGSAAASVARGRAPIVVATALLVVGRVFVFVAARHGGCLRSHTVVVSTQLLSNESINPLSKEVMSYSVITSECQSGEREHRSLSLTGREETKTSVFLIKK